MRQRPRTREDAAYKKHESRSRVWPLPPKNHGLRGTIRERMDRRGRMTTSKPKILCRLGEGATSPTRPRTGHPGRGTRKSTTEKQHAISEHLHVLHAMLCGSGLKSTENLELHLKNEVDRSATANEVPMTARQSPTWRRPRGYDGAADPVPPTTKHRGRCDVLCVAVPGVILRNGPIEDGTLWRTAPNPSHK